MCHNVERETVLCLRCAGITLDVSYYNLLLSLYLENRHGFMVPQFLEQMKTAGIQPNRVTYQRLIAHYCLGGNMEGAR